MKRLLVGIGALLAFALFFVGAIIVASETGAEVVTVETTNADGGTSSTRLWVVDDGGFAWLRAGMGRVKWVDQAQAAGELVMTRAGSDRRYRVAVFDDPETRDRIHSLMAEKYGAQDKLIAMIRDGAGSIAIRLEAIEQAGTRTGGGNRYGSSADVFDWSDVDGLVLAGLG